MASVWTKILARVTGNNLIRSARTVGFSNSGVAVTEDTAAKVAAVYRGLMYLSTQISKLPWEVKDKNYNILDNDISNLIDLCPNPEMNSFQWRLVMMQNAIMHGNAYAEIERRNDGKPIALWFLPSRDVTPWRSSKGDLIYKVSGESSPGTDTYLRAKDVFHLRNFHTKDGIVGQGLLAYAAESIGIAIAADRMASSLFKNSGLPSGILTTPGSLTDEQFARVKESWDSNNSGRKTGGTALLEEGTTWKAISTDPTLLQFLESRQFAVLEIARFFGVPPTKFFDVTAATYSNQEQSNLEVATDVLHAWANNFEMEADIKILNTRFGGNFTEMDLYSIYRGDMTTRSEYFVKMMGVGAITSNQIRAREGQSPYPAGNTYFIAANNLTPTDRINDVVDANIASKLKSSTTPAADKTPAPTDPNLAQAAIDYLKKG